MTAPTKILLDTGPSERGWHRLERFLTCPLKYYWATTGERPRPGVPLVRGSIGHVGLAHMYARMRARDAGDQADFDRYYQPSVAMNMVAQKFDAGRMMPGLLKLLLDYSQHYRTETFKVLEVEKGFETSFEGHRYTARADLVVKGADGRVWIYDHKITGRVETKTLRRYALSGQFFGLHHLGQRAYGRDFGGVKLNILGMDGKFVRSDLEPAPFLLAAFPKVVAAAEARIASLAGQPLAVWAAQAVPSEISCYVPYGECEHFEACRWGHR